MGVWVQSPQRCPEAEPMSGGKTHPEAESFETFAHQKKAQILLSICQDHLNLALIRKPFSVHEKELL